MAGNGLRIRISKSRTSRQTHGLKFGMVGTYKSYFRNVKRKGKVSFDHSTTLKRIFGVNDGAWKVISYPEITLSLEM